MADPVLSNGMNLLLGGAGGGPVPVAVGFGGGFGGGFSSPPDVAVGDMKMAARTDDHFEGAAEWLLCDFRALDRTTYSALFAVIGVNFGPGDGVATFNLPSFAAEAGGADGRFPVGLGFYALGNRAGSARHVHANEDSILAAPHTYFPSDQSQQLMAGTPSTFSPGSGVVGTGDGLHSHTMPPVDHDPLPGAWPTDTPAADLINPYVALGFFIRAR